MTDTVLKPCPFCGGTAEIKRRGTARMSMLIGCVDCHAEVESGDVCGVTAVENYKWNMRKPLAKQEHTDDLAVNRFSEAMKKKLSKKRKAGRSGWDDPEQCSIDFLIRLLHEHYQKGDVVDIANICMMLNQRGAKADWRLPADRLTAMTALERENKELRQRIRQFEFCIGRVAIALGGVCCGGVDVTLQHLQADPHSTTRVLCDAIAALREEGK